MDSPAHTRLNQAYEHPAGFHSGPATSLILEAKGEDGTPTPTARPRRSASLRQQKQRDSRMSCALNLEMREVEKALRVANTAVIREEWAEAERALAEVQDRVGRLLREVALKPTSVPIPIAEPPSESARGKPAAPAV